MGRVGSNGDDATMESFFAVLQKYSLRLPLLDSRG